MLFRSFEDSPSSADFNIYILDEQNRVEVYRHCEGSKEELVRDVSRFYSSSHDRFTYGSGFINFNLPQFYQLVAESGKTRVLPFRSASHDEVAEHVSPQLSQNILPRSKNLF